MNGDDLRFLAHRADEVRGRADQRLDEVRGRIASTRRRHAIEAVSATSAAVLAVVVGVALLTGPAGRQKGDGPPPPANSPAPATKAVREIVYSDDLSSIPHKVDTPLGRVGSVHVGGREVRIDQVLHTVQRWAMFVTDGGAVYAKDDQTVWLTDGGEPRQIAEQACVDTTQSTGLATGNAGPWAVWFDCSAASQGADLVVFDTVAGREVARHSVPSCRGRQRGWLANTCSPSSVIGDHVYFWVADDRVEDGTRDFVLDVASDEVVRATAASYAQDVDSHPRGLVLGDDAQTGTRTDGLGQVFRVVGQRLVPELDLDSEQVLVEAFDTATGRAVTMRLPDGYHVRRNDPTDDPPFFVLFEWLDDDTVALTRGNATTHSGDIVVCHLSAGRCEVSVEAPHGDVTRIVANGHLPG